jgi:hypothetical protein
MRRPDPGAALAALLAGAAALSPASSFSGS